MVRKPKSDQGHIFRMPSKLRYPTSLSLVEPAQTTTSSTSPPIKISQITEQFNSLSIGKKQEKSLPQIYHIAYPKLLKEAGRKEPALSLLVGHANLLDALVIASRKAERDPEMSLAQIYDLADTKFHKEADQKDVDLRLLVGHSNLLEGLDLALDEAERDHESQFSRTVMGDRSRCKTESSSSDFLNPVDPLLPDAHHAEATNACKPNNELTA